MIRQHHRLDAVKLVKLLTAVFKGNRIYLNCLNWKKNQMKKYLFYRLIVIISFLISFLIYGIIFIENSRSCLGNPKILPTIFIGFPLLFIFLIIDSIFTFVKKDNRKHIVYPFILYFFILFLTVLMYGNS